MQVSKQRVKKAWIIIFMVCVTISAYSKQGLTGDPENTPVKTIISGYVREKKGSNEVVRLRKWDDNNFIEGSQEYSTNLANGYFKFEMLISNISEIAIIIGDSSDSYGNAVFILKNCYDHPTLYIEPGDSIHIQMSDLAHSSLADVILSGKGCEKQFLLRDIAKKIAEANNKDGGYRKDFLEPGIDRAIIVKQVILSSLANNEYKISEQARKALQIKLLTVLYLASADLFNASDLTSPQVRKIYYEKYLKNFPIHDDLLLSANMEGGLNSSWHGALQKQALLSYMMTNNLPYKPGFSKNKKKLFYEIIKTDYNTSPQKTRILARYIIERIKHKGLDDEMKSVIEDYYSYLPKNNFFRNQVESVKLMHETGLSKSAKAFNFVLSDTSGRMVTLNEFRGKVVFLDFMFTGCGGCAMMVPKLEELEAQFHGKDIVFVSISVDKKLEQVKKGMGKFASKGSLQLYTNGQGYDHELIKNYQIFAYPTLVLIGKDGHIIDARAPDPRNKEGKAKLIQLIEKAL